MQARYDIYRCTTCENVVEMVLAKGGHLICCGNPMVKMEAQASDGAVEKHIPVIEVKEEGVLVSVGAVAHPMTEEHSIQWIELTVDGVVYKKYLNPGDSPVALFKGLKGQEITAREYCNLHGLWKN